MLFIQVLVLGVIVYQWISYLTYKVKHGIITKFIKLASQINDKRPFEISDIISKYIKKEKLKKVFLFWVILTRKLR